MFSKYYFNIFLHRIIWFCEPALLSWASKWMLTEHSTLWPPKLYSDYIKNNYLNWFPYYVHGSFKYIRNEIKSIYCTEFNNKIDFLHVSMRRNRIGLNTGSGKIKIIFGELRAARCWVQGSGSKYNDEDQREPMASRPVGRWNQGSPRKW